MEALENTVTGKTTEIRHLQKQLSDAERDKHTELVKLRLEVGEPLRLHNDNVWIFNNSFNIILSNSSCL